MSHDHGMFRNDLFNGEALSGGHESDRGIFRSNLFDGEPLGQTTPSHVSMPERLIRDNGLFARDIFSSGPLGQATAVTAAPDSLISQLASGGGATGGKTGTTSTSSTGDKSGGSSMSTPSAYTPYIDPNASASAMPMDSSSTPWVPIALIGGAVVLTIGIVAMASRKPAAAKATANRRGRRARRNRRSKR